MSATVSSVIHRTVPKAIYVNEMSKFLVRQWKGSSGKNKLRLAPLKLHVGIGEQRIVYFQKSTRITFYWVVYLIRLIICCWQYLKMPFEQFGTEQ
jgi:hypothetical protein